MSESAIEEQVGSPRSITDPASNVESSENQPVPTTQLASPKSTNAGLLGKILEYVVSSSPVAAPSNTNHKTASDEAYAGVLSPSPPKSTPTKVSFPRGTRIPSVPLHTPSFLDSPIRWGALAGSYAPNLVTPPRLANTSPSPTNIVVPDFALSAEPMSRSSANIVSIGSIESIDDIDIGSDLVAASIADDNSVKSTPKATRLNHVDADSCIKCANSTTSTLTTPVKTLPSNNATLEMESPVIGEDDDDVILSTPSRNPSSDSKAGKELWILETSPPPFTLPTPAPNNEKQSKLSFSNIENKFDSVEGFLPDLDGDFALSDEAPPFTSSRTQSDLYLNESKSSSANTSPKQSSTVVKENDAIVDDMDGIKVNGERRESHHFTSSGKNRNIDIPADWMLSTPSSITRSPVNSNSSSETKPAHSNPLIDVTSPKSVVKYSEKDLERIKREMREQFDKESELVQEEIRELMAQRESSADKYRKIQSTLAEWEQTMKDMINDSQKEKETFNRTIDKQKLMVDSLKEENNKLAKERDRAALQAKQANVLLESGQKDNEDLKEKIDLLQHDLDIAQQRYDVLKSHAEEKLESANVEIAKVRATYEKDVSAYKIRISKADLQASSLEKLVEQKTNENIELTKICDQLLAHVQSGSP